MAKNLLIVESPAKAATIKKFLGNNYEVLASNGHVRDLPKSKMGIDTEHDFEPQYITIRGKSEVINNLKKAVKKADKIYLATDPDREGEAISYHLKELLKLDPKNTTRVTFNEITKKAVSNSIKNSRNIDMNLVNAQQARRVLDRLVGYEISPVLWQKVKRGLSAGRVQSVALRIICDREDEINAFDQKEYWTIDAIFKAGQTALESKFYGDEKGKIEIGTKKEADAIVKKLEKGTPVVKEVKNGERKRNAPNPFTTSTLQQECSKKLNFATAKTMLVAQQLYEGVNVKGHGTIGLITYLRTDSIRVSDEAKAAAEEFITENYGKDFVGSPVVQKKEDKNIQDAHEAIRPTYIELTPAQVKDSLTRDQFRLYQLVWKRFIASRMQAAKYETVSASVDVNGYIFNSTSSKLVFQGFLAVYNDDEEEAQASNAGVKKIKPGDKLKTESFAPEQHFTQPPAHFTEASLIKELEERGIGRPSTYAPTITTILARHYVIKEDKNLYVTELGEAVNNIMKNQFPTIVDVNFTVNLEYLFDKIGEGETDWKEVVRNFYPDLEEAVKAANEELEKIEIKDEVSDVQCENCGRMMVYKYGPHGRFLACPGFPECRNTKTIVEKAGVACPKCGKDIVIRKTKKGRRFYACESPDCDYMSWQKPKAEEKKD
ncbi:MAG: type I DNA topoisomerase [Lachnospiraceae bacterium]|nr:type I DNA topoisomerase [Lachnospiraceae bacterium]